MWPSFLILGLLALLPLGRSVEAPLAIAAIAGLIFAWRKRSQLQMNAGIRLAAALFVCYWLAALLSAPGAVAPDKSWSTVAVLLRFFPFALFATLALRDATVWARLTAGAAAILVLWLLDA